MSIPPGGGQQPAAAGLTEEQRASAMARYVAVIAPHLHDHLPLPAVAAQAGIPLRTAQRWLARYRGQDLAGLARAGRSDRGRRRIQPELVALIEGLALRRPPPRITTIHRRAGEVAAARGWAAPAYATVHAIVTSLDPGLVTLARTARPPTGTGSSWSGAAPRNGPTRSGKPTTANWTCWCWILAAGPPAPG